MVLACKSLCNQTLLIFIFHTHHVTYITIAILLAVLNKVKSNDFVTIKGWII